MRALVNKRIDQPKLKNEIIGYVDRIQEEYQYIQEVLLGSAGSGLSLSIVIHEIEKIIIELNHLVKKEKAPSTVLNLVQHLSKLVEGYTDLIKKSEKKEQDVKKLISGSLFNVNYRLLNHDIKLVKKFESYKGTPAVNCSKKLILGSLLNIIDNSIYWLDKKETTLKKVNKDFTKKIFIDLFKSREHFEILIADNGDGFKLPTSKIIKPFITSKEVGMGLGLHITSEVMKAHKGSLYFPENGEYDMPEEFQKGAKVVLKLKK